MQDTGQERQGDALYPGSRFLRFAEDKLRARTALGDRAERDAQLARQDGQHAWRVKAALATASAKARASLERIICARRKRGVDGGDNLAFGVFRVLLGKVASIVPHFRLMVKRSGNKR
jgi:hypothetical protein